MMSGGREVDVGGERLGSCLAIEHLMMKSSTLFHVYLNADPSPLRPPRVHLRHSRVFPGLPRFSRSSASVYYTECKSKNENRGGLGTRLTLGTVAL